MRAKETSADATKSVNLYTSKPERVLSRGFLYKSSYNQSFGALCQPTSLLVSKPGYRGDTPSVASCLTVRLGGRGRPQPLLSPQQQQALDSPGRLASRKSVATKCLTETTTTIENLRFCKKQSFSAKIWSILLDC